MVYNLPSVHTRHRNGDVDSDGLQIMEAIMARRYPAWKEFFTETQLKRMAMATGGDFRDFLRLARDCLVKTAVEKTIRLPVPDTVLSEAENHLKRDMLPIAEDDKDWLRQVANNKESGLKSIGALPQLARFFDTKLLLNYRNSDDWYDVHPLLADEIKGPSG
jgi:hypothetical protein